MSKVSRSVQAGFANGERRLKQRWERAKAAKGQDRLALKRAKSKPTTLLTTKEPPCTPQ
jgi:hypothetical protein